LSSVQPVCTAWTALVTARVIERREHYSKQTIRIRLFDIRHVHAANKVICGLRSVLYHDL
ncbi:hypothetical protein M9458_034411, partial [Cirrhinus mrigala]